MNARIDTAKVVGHELQRHAPGWITVKLRTSDGDLEWNVDSLAVAQRDWPIGSSVRVELSVIKPKKAGRGTR